MFIATIPNRSSPPAILLREGYRENGKVKIRTLANLSHLPAATIESLRHALKGGRIDLPLSSAFDITKTISHGHVAAILGTIRRIGLDSIISRRPCREKDLTVALVASRLISPASKFATSLDLRQETQTNTLASSLGLKEIDEEDLYSAMDWLLDRQPRIESQLGTRHLSEGSAVLYDLTSTWFEGTHCPLARLGHSRDGRKGTLQIVFGVLADAEGCPVGVEVFPGNTGDPQTVARQIEKIRDRFGIKHFILVGDRGMITQARLREDLAPHADVSWVTALRSPAIGRLLAKGAFQPGLFDERDLCEITDEEFPGERLIVCRNPDLAEERKRKRADLLAATERELEKVRKATQRVKKPLRGKDKIGLRVGKILGRYKMAKHFHLSITEDSFEFNRIQNSIQEEEALDGFYVIRTDVSSARMSSEEVVGAYKGLSKLERVFRNMKSVNVQVRPIYHHLEKRVRSHIFLCLLAAHVEWHMRRSLAPLLFEDSDRIGAQSRRKSIVAKAKRSERAEMKIARKRTEDGRFPVQSFRSLIRNLGMVTQNSIKPFGKGEPFTMTTTPSELQKEAFRLLGVDPRSANLLDKSREKDRPNQKKNG